ncbi:MAG: hypothetical protein OEZ23_04890, partial [Gammaproteobacteria bacterium]|nr:hypothetical protein [Gammaproteobacteria bacterium]
MPEMDYKAVAFVGGGGDRPIGRLVLGKYKAYVQTKKPQQNNLEVTYFQHFQRAALRRFIRRHEGRVCVVSHSWGANSAMRVIAKGN